jgi:hypothetical protein
MLIEYFIIGQSHRTSSIGTSGLNVPSASAFEIAYIYGFPSSVSFLDKGIIVNGYGTFRTDHLTEMAGMAVFAKNHRGHA